MAEAWGYSILATFLISLLALVGIVFFLRFLSHPVVLHLLIAFAIGALVGDAFFHLIPAIFGIHVHGAHGNEDEHEDHDHDHGNSTHEE